MPVYDSTLRGIKLQINQGSDPGVDSELAYALTNTAGQQWTLARIHSVEQSGYQGLLVFETHVGSANPSDATIERMRIDANGNVGIGTTDPLAPLQIGAGTDRPVRSAGLYIANPTGSSQLDMRDCAADIEFQIFTHAPDYQGFKGHTFLGTFSKHRLVLRTADVDRVMITEEGNVGIGTNAPEAKLHINGEVRANRYCGSNTLMLNDYRTANPASNVYLYSPQNDRDSWLFLDRAGVEHGSNWGIYHRQIDAPLHNLLPANSIAFIGGGDSDLKAYVCLGDGSAYFKGAVKTSSLETESLNVQKDLSCNGVQANRVFAAAGGKFHSIAIGESLGLNDPLFPYMYETVGTPSTDHNLRFFSHNWIVFHLGNNLAESGTMALDQSGQWHASSRKLKHNICDLTREEALDALETLRPVTFVFRGDKANMRRSGFIAEEVPAMIANHERTMICQMDIIAILTRAVKEQQCMIKGIMQNLNSMH